MSDIDEQIRNIIGQIPNYILGYLEIGDDIKEEWKGEQPAYLKVYSDRIAKLIANQVREALEDVYEEQKKWSHEHTELKLGYATYMLTIVKDRIAALKGDK